MNSGVPLVWYIAMGVAFGLLLGYAVGMAIGRVTGRQQLLKRIRLLLTHEKIQLDIDRVLISKRGRTIEGFGV